MKNWGRNFFLLSILDGLFFARDLRNGSTIFYIFVERRDFHSYSKVNIF